MRAMEWISPRSVHTRVSVWAVALVAVSAQAGATWPAQLTADQAIARRLEPPPEIVAALHVGDIRLEPAPAAEPPPSAVLRFNLENQGITQLADVVIRITIYDQPPSPLVVPRAVVRPFSVRTSATLESGYSVDYEMLFHNLSADCSCVPSIEILSAKVPRH